jgi:hypothetical protein
MGSASGEQERCSDMCGGVISASPASVSSPEPHRIRHIGLREGFTAVLNG